MDQESSVERSLRHEEEATLGKIQIHYKDRSFCGQKLS